MVVRKPAGWRRWLWALGIAVLLGAGAWGVWGRRPSPPPPKPAQPAQTPKMEGLSLTEIQDGDRRWVLEAKKADFHKDISTVGISGVRVEFFEPGEHIMVKADEGLFNTKTRALTLKGHVEMKRGDLLIETNLASYVPAERVLLAPEDVVLTEPRLRVEGKGLRVELVQKKLVLAEHKLTEVKLRAGGIKP
ncbi:MAG: LPS export ABC transporter periplasmic protein LptC [Syntrophobacterales bacterium]|nr:LPS export ABC transporter periplasmic protein LptC [Syntrophobacterales bacterium]